MGKIAKIALITFAVAINVVPGLGQVVSGAIGSAVLAGLGGSLAAAGIASLAATALLGVVSVGGLEAGTGTLRRRGVALSEGASQ